MLTIWFTAISRVNAAWRKRVLRWLFPGIPFAEGKSIAESMADMVAAGSADEAERWRKAYAAKYPDYYKSESGRDAYEWGHLYSASRNKMDGDIHE